MHLSEATIQNFTIPKLTCYLLWDSKIFSTCYAH